NPLPICNGTTNTVNGVVLHSGDNLLVFATFTVPNCDGRYRILENRVSTVDIDTHNHDTPNCLQFGITNQGPDQVTILRPGIQCTKSCTTVGAGENAIIIFTGTVTNTGNVALTNVFVTNCVNGVCTQVLGPTNVLGEGGSLTYSNFYAPGCGTHIDTVLVGGAEINLQQTISNVRSSCSSTCSVPCLPAIVVYKQVVCELPTGCEAFSANIATGNKTATGATVTNSPPAPPPICPAFCYRIIVTNAGNVTLTGVTVTDSNDGN